MISNLAPSAWAFLEASANRSPNRTISDLAAQSEPPRERRFRGVPIVELPTPRPAAGHLADALAGRLSCRRFGGAALNIDDLSTVLHGSYGVLGTARTPAGQMLERPIPSGGGRYPLEVYLLVRRADGVPSGIFHYAPRLHVLEQIRGPLPWTSVVRLFLDQPYLTEADALVVVTGVAGRTLSKYGERGFRFLWLEAGHLGQNLSLIAAGSDIGCLPLAGFYDQPLADLLGIDSNVEPPLYAFALGRPSCDGRGERRSVDDP